LNKEIVVLDRKIEESKFKDHTDKCLYLQLQVGETKYVLFTGSKYLIDMIQKVPPGDFPFKTTIIEENERYEFT
jgi:hypothetical protein